MTPHGVSATLRFCGWMFFVAGLLLGLYYTLNALMVATGHNPSASGADVVGLYVVIAALSFLGAFFWLALCQAVAYLVESAAMWRREQAHQYRIRRERQEHATQERIGGRVD